ncbi:MAG: hypothetical protein ABIO70_07500 [Pseudomonadota bacterium]
MPRLAALALLALSCGPRAPRLPEGAWRLEGDGAVGALAVDAEGVRVGLWGAHFTTRGESVPATTSADEAGQPWLDFALDTAAGPAAATLGLDMAAGTAVLPLGYRPGELELTLALHEGPMEPLDRQRLITEAEQELPALQAAWAEGSFQLRDAAGHLQGMVVLLPGSAAQVQLVTETALTAGLARAHRRAEGPDQVITFEVEPRMEEELGQLRLNVPTLRVVLPVGRMPHPDDRWLQARPGAPSADALQARLAEVERASLAAERALLARLGPALAAEATTRRGQEGACPAFAAMGPDWEVLLGDYQVAITPTDAGCAVHLEPSIVQHTRRTAATATAEGLGDVEVLER